MTVTQQLAKPEPVKQVAKRIVNECLQVQPDEQVAIFTFDHTLDYATALAVEVENAGGVSNTILQTNDFYWSYLKEVPEAQFTRQQRALLSQLHQTDAGIGLGGPKDPSKFQTVPDGRTGKFIQAQKPQGDMFMQRKIRFLNLPIGLVTPERAKTYGFDYDNWQRVSTNSLDVDHSKISALAGKIESRLRNATDIRVTAANGTDLRMKLKGRPVHIHDGIIDKTDVEKGTIFEALPAGAVELVPDETSAQGTVLYDQPTALAGRVLSGLKLQFENGRVTNYTANANLDAFKDSYENTTGDKDRIANLVIGLNPRSELIGFFTDRYVQGTVSIGIGGNQGIGGTNDSGFGHEETLKKPTLTVDNYKLVDQGKLMP